LLCVSLYPANIAGCPARLDARVVTFRPPQPLEFFPECGEFGLRFRIGLRQGNQHANAPHYARLLRARGKRPSSCRTSDCNEVAPPHSITSSASASSVGGPWRPSALAVLRVIATSYLV